MTDAQGLGATDTHTHLNHPRLLRRLPEVLSRARAAGVETMVVVGYNLASSETAVRLAQTNEGLWATVGVHPHDADALDGGVVVRLRELAGSGRVVAIGETGLDFCRDFSPREAQVAAFRAQLALAEELGLPVVVHCRAAQETLLAILRERPPTGLVWHCFDGSREQARAAIELGAALGFTGSVTYRESDELRRVAAELPEDRLLLETDCPYLGPEPRRKGDNEPGNLPLIAQAVAKARATSMEGMLNTTTINARRVFCLGRT